MNGSGRIRVTLGSEDFIGLMLRVAFEKHGVGGWAEKAVEGHRSSKTLARGLGAFKIHSLLFAGLGCWRPGWQRMD